MSRHIQTYDYNVNINDPIPQETLKPRRLTINDIARERAKAEQNESKDQVDRWIEPEEARQSAREITAILSALRYKSTLKCMIVALYGQLPEGQTAVQITHAKLGDLCRGDVPDPDEHSDKQWVDRRCVEHRQAVESTGEKWRLMKVIPGKIERAANGRDVYIDSTFDLAPLLKLKRSVRESAQEDIRWARGGTERIAATKAAANAKLGGVVREKPRQRTPAHPDRLLKIMGGYIGSIVNGCDVVGLDPRDYRAKLDALWDEAFAKLPNLDPDPDPESNDQIDPRIAADDESKARFDTLLRKEEEGYPDWAWIQIEEVDDVAETPSVQTQESSEQRNREEEKPGKPSPFSSSRSSCSDSSLSDHGPRWNPEFNSKNLNDRLRALAEDRGVNQWHMMACPLHDDDTPSVHVTDTVDWVRMYCHSCNRSGRAILDLLDGGTVPTPIPQVSVGEHSTQKGKLARIVANYVYRDAKGDPVYKVLRTDPKGFPILRYDVTRATYVGGLNGLNRILYRLPDLVRADPSRPVLVTESEHSANLLTRHEFVAVAIGGANAFNSLTMVEPLRGRKVVLLPDNNEPGVNLSRRMRRALQGVAESVTELVLDGLGDGEAVDNWIEKYGHSPEELRERVSEI